MDDVRAAVAGAELLGEFAHALPRRPRVDERRRPSVREPQGALPRVVEAERLELRRSEQLDRGGVAGDADGAAGTEADELVREVEDMNGAVAREVLIVDEDDVHAATCGR